MTGTGRASINLSKVIAGGLYCFQIVYETGSFGIDDGGEIIIARRHVCDAAIPQFDDPFSPGYVSVRTDAPVSLKPRYITDRYIRPWQSCISIRVTDGSLRPGDQVLISYGAPEDKGMGFVMQTFAEKEHIFRVMVDCAGSGLFYDIDEQPVIEITGGYARELQMVAPSQIEPDQPFDVFIRAVDSYGNIAEQTSTAVSVYRAGQLIGQTDLQQGTGYLRSVVLQKTGHETLTVCTSDQTLWGSSHPVHCTRDKKLNLYWGDMHGQTKETVGTGSLDLYFTFARDKARMDFCGWQGNDFQVTDELWDAVCKATKTYHEPGRFVTFLGYEWSGTTPSGGDHNIYYLNDDQPIHRSYRWQIGMEATDDTDKHTLRDLFDTFEGRTDVMAVPHVGGRYGNIDYYDDTLIHLMEIHSHHGTFDWFVEEAIARGLQPGILAASDDHTCRPGLSYPTRKTSGGRLSFDVTGGYTAVYADSLTRESLWNAFRQRHTYGTTGQRILLNVTCGNQMMGDSFSIDHEPTIEVDVTGTGAIMDVEIRNGLNTIKRYHDTLEKDRRRIRIVWSGVRVRSRSKKTDWDGTLSIKAGTASNLSCFAFNQPDERAYMMSGQDIRWTSKTSGDIDGIEFDLDWNDETTLTFSTRPAQFSVRIRDLMEQDVVYDAGGVNQKVTVGFATVALDQQAQLSVTDTSVKAGVNAYWVKVTQKDGHMAWSSPMYVTYNP